MPWFLMWLFSFFHRPWYREISTNIFIQSINGLVIDSLTRLSVSDINSSDSVAQDGS